MSAIGVRKRLLQAILDGDGRLERAAWEAVLRYAQGGPLTRGEREALVNLDAVLSNPAALAEAGLGPDRLRLSADALSAMERFAAQHDLSVVLGGLRIEGAAPSPSPADAPASPLAAALAAGQPLGPFSTWAVQTPGADVRFSTQAFGQTFPALVVTRPDFTDPDRRDLASDLAQDLAGLQDLDGVRALARRVLARDAGWFSAADAASGTRNRRAALRQQRLTRLLDLLRDHALARPQLGLAVNAVLIEVRDDALSGIDHDMEVGSHTNYWPYDKGYDGVVEKILSQVAPGSPAATAIGNRLADIWRRKTVFTHGRSVDERDAERSLGAILTWRRPHGPPEAPRVSLAQGSTPDQPRYAVLSVTEADGGTVPVYREGDGSLRYDWTAGRPERVGQARRPLPRPA